jgi:hypothetical protein
LEDTLKWVSLSWVLSLFELVVVLVLLLLQGKTKCFFWDRSKFSFRICDPSPNAFHLSKAMSVWEFEMIGFDRSNILFFLLTEIVHT